MLREVVKNVIPTMDNICQKSNANFREVMILANIVMNIEKCTLEEGINIVLGAIGDGTYDCLKEKIVDKSFLPISVQEFRKLAAEFMRKYTLFDKSCLVFFIEDYGFDIDNETMQAIKDLYDYHRKEYDIIEEKIIDITTEIVYRGKEVQEEYFGRSFEDYNQEEYPEKKQILRSLLSDAIKSTLYFDPSDSDCDDTLFAQFVEQFSEIITIHE